MTRKSSDWSEILQWEKQISTSFSIEESAGQCSRQICYRRKFDASVDTYNVQRHGWTTQTGSQGSWRSGPSTKRKICLTLSGTMWTRLRVLMLKSDYLQGRWRTRSLNKLSFWILNLKKVSIYLMYGVLYIIKLKLINPFVKFYKKIFRMFTFYP